MSFLTLIVLLLLVRLSLLVRLRLVVEVTSVLGRGILMLSLLLVVAFTGLTASHGGPSPLILIVARAVLGGSVGSSPATIAATLALTARTSRVLPSWPTSPRPVLVVLSTVLLLLCLGCLIQAPARVTGIVVALIVVLLSGPALPGQLSSLFVVAVNETAIVIGHAHVYTAHLRMAWLVGSVFVGTLIHRTTIALAVIVGGVVALLALRFGWTLHLLVLLVRLLVTLLVLHLAGVLLLE
jgi:hypothetical protein